MIYKKLLQDKITKQLYNQYLIVDKVLGTLLPIDETQRLSSEQNASHCRGFSMLQIWENVSTGLRASEQRKWRNFPSFSGAWARQIVVDGLIFILWFVLI